MNKVTIQLVREVRETNEQLGQEQQAELRRCMSFGIQVVKWVDHGLVDRLTEDGVSWLRETLAYARELLRVQQMDLEPDDVVEYTPYGATDRVQVTLRGRSPSGSLNVFTVDSHLVGDGLLNVAGLDTNVQLIKRGPRPPVRRENPW